MLQRKEKYVMRRILGGKKMLTTKKLGDKNVIGLEVENVMKVVDESNRLL